MKVTVAIDSFKGSLDTFSSGAAVSEAVRAVFEDAEVKVCIPRRSGAKNTSR